MAELDDLTALQNNGTINPTQATRLNQLQSMQPGGSGGASATPTAGVFGGTSTGAFPQTSYSGANGFKLPDFSQFFNNYGTGLNNAVSGGLGTLSDFQKQYSGAIAGQESIPAMASRIGSELGIPQLSSNANTYNTMAQNLPQDIRNITQGFDANNSQVNNVIAQRSQQLAPMVNTANNAFASAENNLSQQLGYGAQQQQTNLAPYAAEGQAIPGIVNTGINQFGQMESNELNGLISQMQSGVQLSTADMNRAVQLSIAEQQNASQLQIAQIASQNARKQAVPIGAYGLYDPSTGQTIGGNSNNIFDQFLTA